MALQFIKKRFRKRPEYLLRPLIQEKREDNVMALPQKENIENQKINSPKTKNNKKNRKEDMINKDQITAIEAAMEKMQPEVKVVKADRGLIERTESSKIIITEDNRQVLND